MGCNVSDELQYDHFINGLYGIGNINIKWHPLRDEDESAFERYRSHFYTIGNDISMKRK